MSFLARDNAAIKVTPSLEQEISEATSTSAIHEILHRAAVSQHLIEPDPLDRDGKDYFNYKPVQPGTAAAANGFAKVLIVDGIKHVVEGATEAELASNELALMRSLFGGNNGATEQTRNSAGQFVSQADIEAEAARVAAANADPAARIEADLVARALAAQGIDMDTLKEYSLTKQGEKFQQSWADATETFRANHPDWMGGLDNQNLFAKLLSENNLVDAEDKAAALEAVYNYAVENKMLIEPAEKTLERKISEARTVEEIQAAIGYRSMDGRDSGMWGR
jgi:hypothetical protein